MIRNVALLLFDDVEVLDFCGPLEVFGAARGPGEEQPFRVYTVAEKAGPVQARHGLSVNPNFTFADCPPPALLLVPGGRGTRREIQNQALVDWVKAEAGRVELLLSVCTGALILAQAGLLDGLAATTHFLAFDELRALAPRTKCCPEERYVDNGRIILAAGVSAGIDLALYIVGRLLGAAYAGETARFIQYDYWPRER